LTNQNRANARVPRDTYQDVQNRYECGINGGRVRSWTYADHDATEVDAVVITGQRRSKRRVKHPGFVESLVPIWGSGKEAIADFQEGDIVGGVGNTLLVVTDLVPGGYLVKTIGKASIRGLVKTKGSHTVGATREWMVRKGYQRASDLGVERHHWLIPNKGWGANVPDYIKNQPFNLHEMNPATHQRLHRRWDGEERYGPIERTLKGTPAWALAPGATTPGKVFEGLRDYYDQSEEE